VHFNSQQHNPRSSPSWVHPRNTQPCRHVFRGDDLTTKAPTPVGSAARLLVFVESCQVRFSMDVSCIAGHFSSPRARPSLPLLASSAGYSPTDFQDIRIQL
jgi:hypothetical protein